MALTTEEINKIAKILNLPKSYINAQIDVLGDDLTAQDETDIRAELTRWDGGAGADFVRIHPKEKNFGAEIDPDDTKADIRRNIAILLGLETSAYSSYGMGTLEIGL